MKNGVLSFVLLTVFLASAGAQSDEIIVYRLPEPQRVYIFRPDNVVYNASIPAASIINNSFILPENARPESVTIFQEGRRIFTFTTFAAEAVVVLQRGQMPRQIRVVQVHVPELNPAMPLDVTYGVKNAGLSWDFMLDLEMVNATDLNSALIAEIRSVENLPEVTRLILAREPEIILTASTNALLEDAAFSFNLGKLTIEANRQQSIRLEEGRTPYRIVYQWDASRHERPIAYLRAQTPIKTMANSVRFNLSAGGIITVSSSNTEISPARPFDIAIGEQSNIVTFRSHVTAETKHETLPFTHTAEYRVENRSSRTIDLEILVPIEFGNKYRTQYTFTSKEPDERPGGMMLWRYTVASGEEAVLQFSFDADIRNPSSYRQFDYYEGGR